MLPQPKFKWLKYSVYFWAFRLSFLGLGVFIPIIYFFFSSIRTYIDVFVGNPLIMYKNISYEESNVNFDIFSPIQLQKDQAVVVIRGFPLNGINHIHEMINITVHKITNAAKIRNGTEFTYYTDDRPWVIKKHINISKNYELTTLDNIERFSSPIDTCSSNSECQKKNFSNWYVTIPIPESIRNGWIRSISPSFQNYISKAPSQLQSVLFLSNDQTLATYHYDMVNNFFLQLTGSKTFYITEPSAYKYFKPYGCLHPLWRQVQNPSISMNNKHFKSWIITLFPGDMLYLPAFYFHQVIAHNESSSINAWYSVNELKNYEELLKHVSMPFIKSNPFDIKLTSLTKSIQLAAKKLINLDSNIFYTGLLHRNSNELIASCSVESVCNSITFQTILSKLL